MYICGTDGSARDTLEREIGLRVFSKDQSTFCMSWEHCRVLRFVGKVCMDGKPGAEAECGREGMWAEKHPAGGEDVFHY